VNADPEPEFPINVPVIVPVIAVTFHVYVVPAIFDEIVIDGIELLHIVCEFGLMTGRGLTITVAVTGAPVQAPALGVIVYVTVRGEFEVFTKIGRAHV
jgi:hypothetical protein